MRVDPRPCPFCGHEHPELVELVELVEAVFVRCPECGAIGPLAGREHPVGTAERLWNYRLAMES